MVATGSAHLVEDQKDCPKGTFAERPCLEEQAVVDPLGRKLVAKCHVLAEEVKHGRGLKAVVFGRRP